MKKKIFLVLILAALVLSCVFAQGAKEAAPQAAKTPKAKMTYGLLNVINDLVPYNNTVANNIFAYSFYLETLLSRCHYDTNEYGPLLAKSYEVSSDGKTYTFYLQENVVFHNGDKMTAEDVKWSFEKAMTYATANAQLQSVESIDVVDDYTVRFNLSKVDANFLNTVASTVTVITSKRAIEEDDKNGWMVGTGPYKFDEYVSKDHTVFTKFDQWWGDVENIKTQTVEILQVAENSSRTMGMQTGELDFAIDISPADLESFEAYPEIKTIAMPSYGIDYIVVNMDSRAPATAVLSNIHFRKALNYAVDRESIIAVVAGGVAADGEKTGIIPVGYSYYTEPDEYYTYDMDKAKEEMALSGVPAGTTLLVSINQTRYAGLFELLQESWAKLGVNLEITTSGNSTNKLFDIMICRWTPTSLQAMMNSLLGTGTANRSNCYEYLDLVDAAGQSKTDEEAIANYRAINAAVIANATHMPMYGLVGTYAVKASMEGYTYAPCWCWSDFTHAVIYE